MAETKLKPQSIIDLNQSNRIINGNFDVWQRTTSRAFVSGNAAEYVADRWISYTGGATGASTISRQSFTLGQTDVPNNPQYFLRHSQSAAASTTDPLLVQRIENVETFSGSKATLSVWMKCASGTVTVIPTLHQMFGTGGSPSSITTISPDSGGNITATTTWTKYTRTYTIPSITGKTIGSDANSHYFQLVFSLPQGSTYTLDVAQVQLCAGDQPLPFQNRTYAEELRDCLRYYERRSPGNNGVVAIGSAMSTTVVRAIYQSIVPMRKVPTISSYSDLYLGDGTSAVLSAVPTISMGNTLVSFLEFTVASGLTQFRPYMIYGSSGTAHLAITAEL